MAPSTINSNSQSEPLIPKISDEQPKTLPPVSAGAIKALSVLRIAFGASCMIAPRWSCGIFAFPVPANMAILVRLFGIRDLMLGELLFTAEDKSKPCGGMREIKRALWANIGVDAVDIGSLAFGLATGMVGKMPAVLFAGAATAGVGLGMLGLH